MDNTLFGQSDSLEDELLRLFLQERTAQQPVILLDPALPFIDQLNSYQVYYQLPSMDQYFWLFPALYSISQKDQQLVWQIGYSPDEGLVTIFGHCQGAKQRQTRTVTLNQRSLCLSEQGFVEARFRYSKKYQTGYTPISTNATYKISPMLANKYQPGKTKLKWPIGLQAKVDGIRGLAYLQTGQPLDLALTSRTNKPFSFKEHLRQQLKELLGFLPVGSAIDGEFYNHDREFRWVTSVTNSPTNRHPEEYELQYYIFDLVEQQYLPYRQRHQLLEQAFQQWQDQRKDQPQHLSLVPYVEITAEQSDLIEVYHDQLVKAGYEGLMLRQLDGETARYQHKRTSALLKYKKFLDEEVVIVDVYSGEGTEVGLANFRCQDQAGRQIKLRPRGTFEERRLWYQQPNLVIGRLYTVRHFQEGGYDNLRFPVGVGFHKKGVGFRDYN